MNNSDWGGGQEVSSPILPPPSLRLVVDRGALAANWRALDAFSGTAAAGAAVKADCYGLGVDNCVPSCAMWGARRFSWPIGARFPLLPAMFPRTRSRCSTVR
jgi:alanine racemase